MEKLLAGNELQADTKGGDMCTIANIPVLVTTNTRQFGHGLLGGDTEAALATRVIEINISKNFEKGVEKIGGTLTDRGFYNWIYKHAM